jgi:hypothetical protein
MYASTGQVAAQMRRTARSHRFLIRLSILCAAFAAAVLAGTAAAQADEQNAAPEVAQGESAADGAKPLPPKQPSSIDLTDLAGTVAPVTEIVTETAELAEEVPAAGVPAPVVGVVAHAVRGVAATASDTVLGGAEAGGVDLVANALHVALPAVASGDLPEDGAGTEVPAPEAPAPAPASASASAPSHQNSVEPFVLSAVGEFERARRHAVPVPSETSRPAAARTSAGSGAADRRSGPDAAAQVEAPAVTPSDLGGGIPLNELLDGDHSVVSSGGVAADRATPDSTGYCDRAGLVSDPVRTGARPRSEPVARPGFAPD